MNKDELLDALEDSREAFLDELEKIPPALWEQPGVVDSWSIKDILYHLTMREAELVKILWQISQGQNPTATALSNLSEQERNALWQAQAQARPFEQVLEDFRGVRKQTSRRILEIPDNLLQESQRYPWLKDQPLWEYVAGSSFIHESEHLKSIQEWQYDGKPI